MTDQTGDSLPEEIRLRGALRGSLIVGALCLLAFVGLTVFKWMHSPGDVTSNWFVAWGTWAGGFGTAAAFIIAAFSISVASAHARTDRQLAAKIRADDEMAQARLLTVFKVDIPGAFPGLATFRIENRSQQCIFDVQVPFAEVPAQSGDGIERRTQDIVEAGGRLHEYLPSGELLTPYMQSTTHETWYTEVTLHTRNWQQVVFSVEYTDSSGRRWQQHVDGHIERLLVDQSIIVKTADRFQRGYQIELISDEKARQLGGRFAKHLPPLESDKDFLEALGTELVSRWRRVEHKDKPLVRPDPDHPSNSKIEMPYKPTAPAWWNDHLKNRLRHYGFGEFAQKSVGESASITVRCADADIATAVEQVHESIEFANDQFEAIELAAARRALDASTASDAQPNS